MTMESPRVSLPKGFTATKFEGYFWDTVSQVVYSLKQGGYLRPLKIKKPNPWNMANEPFYTASVKGRNRRLYLSYLMGLKEENSEIRVGEGYDHHTRAKRSRPAQNERRGVRTTIRVVS